jgi:serine/threonine protein kinase
MIIVYIFQIWDYAERLMIIIIIVFMGLLPYVAPEILKGKLYTQAADIYSFGMIMYFVGTGKQPFQIVHMINIWH